jgi:hypothetical protein
VCIDSVIAKIGGVLFMLAVIIVNVGAYYRSIKHPETGGSILDNKWPAISRTEKTGYVICFVGVCTLLLSGVLKLYLAGLNVCF